MYQRELTTCAYCRRPLRLVAGFCATCHAPASVAGRSRLVAGDRDIPAPLAAGPYDAIERPIIVRSLPPSGNRSLLLAGIAALALAVGLMALHMNAPEAGAPSATRSALVVATAGGATVTSTIAAGTTISITYAVAVTTGSANISLTVTPAGMPLSAVTEQWSDGVTVRTVSLVALAAGDWRVSLSDDGRVLRSVTFHVGK